MFQDYSNICENILLRHEELKGNKTRWEDFTEISAKRDSSTCLALENTFRLMKQNQHVIGKTEVENGLFFLTLIF